MGKMQEVYELWQRGLSAWELGKLLYPDMEPSKAALKVNSLLWKARKRMESKKEKEYGENREYGEDNPVVDYYGERRWVERYEVLSGDYDIYDESVMEYKKRGMLTYEEERYLETKLFLKILYDRYCTDKDVNRRVWEHILFYNKRLNREVFPRRPGTKITRRMAAYFLVILIKIYFDLGWAWIRDVIREVKEDYKIGERELGEMLPLLSKLL